MTEQGMKFQGSGFTVELPEGTADTSSYAFVFPGIGSFSPNLTVRFDPAESLDLQAHVDSVRENYETALDDLAVVGNVPVRSRGEWLYATLVLEWGPADHRIRQKQLFLWVPGEAPTLYTLTGTDLASSFDKSEPVFDGIMRSFQPNGENRPA